GSGARRAQRRERLLDGRPGPLDETATRVGERDAARGAREQRHPDPRLELLHRLAQRRAREAQIARRRREAPAPRLRQKLVHTAEEPDCHCPVLLHSFFVLLLFPTDAVRCTNGGMTKTKTKIAAYAAFGPKQPLGPHTIERRDPGPRDVRID